MKDFISDNLKNILKSDLFPIERLFLWIYINLFLQIKKYFYIEINKTTEMIWHFSREDHSLKFQNSEQLLQLLYLLL